MPSKQKIVVDIAPDGTVSLDAQCFVGQDCAKATEQIEIMLGGVGKKSDTKKPEFYQQPGIGQQVKRTF